jgi:hypothetical protein
VQPAQTVPPAQEYQRRLQCLHAVELRHQRRDRIFGAAKLLTAIVIFVLAIWLIRYHAALVLCLLLPLVVFVALFVFHERVLRILRRCNRLRAFYERGVARLEDRWAGTGQPGDSYLDSAHPYARDLDLFGKGGLFELLCTVRTRASEQTLAAWLLTHASPEEVLARQTAVRELTPLLDLRERLDLAGEDIRIGTHPDALIAWSESTERLNPLFSQVAAPILSILWIAGLIAWFVLGWGYEFAAICLVNLACAWYFYNKAHAFGHQVEDAAHDLDLLAEIFCEIEQQLVSAPKLTALKAALGSDGIASSTAILRLHRIADWIASGHNLFLRIFEPFIFFTPQWVAASERWRIRHGASVRAWIAAAAEFEALSAFACYASEHPAYAFPEFVPDAPCFHAEALAHPLLPTSHAVANNIRLDKSLQLMVISGPNMAGKSTFIRAIGINAVLAHAGAPVRAQRLVLSSLSVAASICVLDSLQGGLSRFYAEILRLKKIDDLSRGAIPVLFLLDELFSGTNSHDRRTGTESMVRNLLARGAIGLISTHDLALAEIASALGPCAANFHFADHLDGDRLRFDYLLTPGVVQTTNALRLMRSIGLEV